MDAHGFIQVNETVLRSVDSDILSFGILIGNLEAFLYRKVGTLAIFDWTLQHMKQCMNKDFSYCILVVE